MPYINFKNNLKSTLQAKLWSDATSIRCNHVVNSTDANARRNAWPDFPFTLTLVNTVNDNIEVIKCTGLAGNVDNYIAFACDRAQESTTAQTFEIATTSVEHRLTSGALNSIISIQASPSVEGHVKLDALAANGSNTAAPGGFGLGATNAPRPDTTLDAANRSGFYKYINTVENNPVGGRWGHLLTFGDASGTKSQLAASDTNPPRIFLRNYYSNAWLDWKELPNGITDSTATTSSTVAASATAVKAVNDAAVHLTGTETVAGEKTFSTPPIIVSASPTIIQKCPDMVAGTNPSSSVVYGGLLPRDNNNYDLGGLRFINETSGQRRCQIGFANATGTGRVWPLRVRVNADDTSYVEVPTPPDTDASTKAATTAWVKNNAAATGDIIASFATSKSGFLLCNGGAYSRTTYADLFAILGTSFGAGDGSTTFNVPDFRGRTLQGADANLKAVLAAGLPNITGTFDANVRTTDYEQMASGAFSRSVSPIVWQGDVDTNGKNQSRFTFSANASNSIYGNSTTVQPPAIAVNIFIKY